ncbi:hypothetical protein C8Q77DRAFT_1153265 [Trametes polyzona]|nr:hypothetical protein C8Q77DRAFT_1153265 [Trametes polyzona]
MLLRTFFLLITVVFTVHNTTAQRITPPDVLSALTKTPSGDVNEILTRCSESHEHGGVNARPEVLCNDQGRKDFITENYDAAIKMARVAVTYLQLPGDLPLFRRYFGNNDIQDVRDVFQRIANEDDDRIVLHRNADPKKQCVGLTFAYTSVKNIYFCDIFFSQEGPDRICRVMVDPILIAAGTVLHELTHATTRTIIDMGGAFGDCGNARRIANSPDAVRNAESYSCFAHEVYKESPACIDLKEKLVVNPGGVEAQWDV